MKKYSFLIVLITAMFYGCTDLDVVPYGEISAETFYKDRVQVEVAVFRPYSYAQQWIIPNGGNHWRFAEMTSDQLAWPQKGRHGYDSGDHGRQHYHSWTPAVNDGTTRNAWRAGYTGIGYCNSVMEDLGKIDFTAIGMTDADKNAYLDELTAVRAWHYLRLMDLYGNIPIVTTVGEPLSPPNLPRIEVFNWIESELLSVVNKLPNLENKYAGRMTKAGVYAMLVEMYLNAQEWIGTPRWDDCIAYCDKLINGEAGGLNGKMQLDDNIDVTYGNRNASQSRELIFQIACDRAQNMWFSRGDLGTYVERDILNTEYGGNNGIVVQPGVIDRYNLKDLRRYSWFLYGIGNGYGPYTVGGAHGRHYMGPYKDIGRKLNDYCLGTEEFIDRPIVYLNKPLKAVIEVSGTSSTPLANRRITIKEWYCPEFPGDEAKLLMEEAYNGSKTKSVLVNAYDGGVNEVYNSGAYNGGRPGNQYTWSRMNDYRFMWQDCAENTGARHNKYKTGPQTDANYGKNHPIVYRLTEIYFSKAEALMRKNGNVATQEAVDLINACKKRAYLPEVWESAEAITEGIRYTTNTLTMDELLQERGREFIFEGKRRIDLIRFDKFEFGLSDWWDANAGYPDGSAGTINRDKTRRIFPLPGEAMEVNLNLKQNPGYN